MRPGSIIRTKWPTRCVSCGKDIAAHAPAKWLGPRLGVQCEECAQAPVTVRKINHE